MTDVTGNISANGRVNVEKSGTSIGTRRTLNFIEGSNISMNIIDDSANEKIDVTINSAGTVGTKPATTVVSETNFGQSPAVGVSNNYAREDHTHGSPANPVPAHASMNGNTHGIGSSGFEDKANRGIINGYPNLDSNAKVPATQLGTGTPDSTTFLRGDQTWAIPPGGGGSISPSNTVVSETNSGQSPNPGVSNLYSRGDHSHGTPTAQNIDQLLPNQLGNAGKFLTTNGTNCSWGVPSGGGTTIIPSTASYIITTDGTTIKAINGSTGSVDYSGTDFSTVMQNAYNAVFRTGGGNIFIKRGKYKNNSIVQLSYFVNISGEGYATNIVNYSSGPVFEFIETGGGVNLFTTIENIYFSGGGTGTGPAIQTKDPSATGYTLTDHITLRDLVIQNMGSYGIYMPSRVEFSTFDNLRVIGNANNGIHATALATNRFSGCNLSENAGDGLYVAWGVGNYYHIYQASANSRYGTEFLGELRSEIHLMYSEHNSNRGLYLNGSGCQAHMYNITDNYTIASSTISYTVGEAYHIARQI